MEAQLTRRCLSAKNLNDEKREVYTRPTRDSDTVWGKYTLRGFENLLSFANEIITVITQCALFNYQIWKPQSASFGCFLTMYLEINESCTAVY